MYLVCFSETINKARFSFEPGFVDNKRGAAFWLPALIRRHLPDRERKLLP